MNKKILVCIMIIVAILALGVSSFVSNPSPSSNPKLGSNSTIILPTTPQHYTLQLNDTAGPSLH